MTISCAMRRSPAVFIQGARQTGKSTLARMLAREWPGATYQSLDHVDTLLAMRRDPDRFLAGHRTPLILDEVQVVPEAFRAIKVLIDDDRRNGMFLLTGSANPLFLPRASESLAGRIEMLTLWPFSAGEMAGRSENMVHSLFNGCPPNELPIDPDASLEKVIAQALVGGYPEIALAANPQEGARWFNSYLTAAVLRDIRQISDIAEAITLVPLLRFLADQSGGLLNIAACSRTIGLAQPTIKRYLGLLEATHVYAPLQPWAKSVRKRLTRSHKVYLNDTGLLRHLLPLAPEAFATSSPHTGMLLEAYVYQELRKQLEFTDQVRQLFYYRTLAGREVDFLVEDQNGSIVAIEVKTTLKLTPADLRGLEDVAETVGDKLVAGIVLHSGRQAVPLGGKLWALPWGAFVPAAPAKLQAGSLGEL